MEFSEVVRRRRMVRSYDPSRPVSRADVDAMLDLAVRAPSAGFTQGWQFVVLESPYSIREFWSATTSSDAAPDAWLRRLMTAPALILCLSDKQAYLDRYAEADKGWTDRSDSRWPTPYWHTDTAMASMIFLLAATDRGLATCFFGVPPEAHESVKRAFELDDRLHLVGVVSLGYPAPDRKSPSLKRGRRPMSEVVSYR